MSTVHDFRRDLAYSHAQTDAPWWEQVYRAAFPDFHSMTDLRADGDHQRAGVDRHVTLTSGRVLEVDEKVRRKDYGDILLEYWSDEARRRPGWVAKNLRCDYIAYAIEPSATCYLIPFQPLRRAWSTYGRQWVAAFGRRDARNNGYVTVSCPVPTDVLMQAITDAMSLTWARSADEIVWDEAA
jgi:hypothetical protein